MLVFVYCPCCGYKVTQREHPKMASERDNQPWFADRMRGGPEKVRFCQTRFRNADRPCPANQTALPIIYDCATYPSTSSPSYDATDACRVPRQRGPSVICDDRSAEVVDASTTNRTKRTLLAIFHPS